MPKHPTNPTKGAPATGLSKLDEYGFATEQDMKNRVDNGYGREHTPNPGENPPSFVQIKPGLSGKNVNRPSLGHVKGEMKFSGFKP